MGNVKIQLVKGAVAELLTGTDMATDLEARGKRIAAAAGPGHRVVSEKGRRRVRVAVITHTAAARRAEAVNRNLTRAVDAGRQR
jgi:hypothetical protein